jgi:hypothetical protein
VKQPGQLWTGARAANPLGRPDFDGPVRLLGTFD